MPARLLLLSLAFLLSACVTNRSLESGVADTSLDLALKDALFRDTNYDTSDIDITIFERRVLLSGTARSVDARRDLSMKARSMAGVDEVINEVVVGPRTAFGQGTKDALIDQKFGWALKADNGIYRDNYQFSVSNGVIYLLGVAQGPAELDRVLGQARVIDGVKDIVPHVVFVADPRRAKT